MNVNIHYTIHELAGFTGGILIKEDPGDSTLHYLSLDSRRILFPASTVFFSINSRDDKAAVFMQSLYAKGVRNFLADSKHIDLDLFPGANIIQVENTVDALQKLAIHHRHEFTDLPVIGITGSNGKTVVKEWLFQLLNHEYSIVRSPKSYNSQIGVPLSVLNILPSNNLGIFEAGISMPEEMENLQRIIQPTIGILTNVGNAHDEGFESRHHKLDEKLLLFQQAKMLIVCSNDETIFDDITLFQKAHPSLKLFTWGNGEQNDVRISSIERGDLKSVIEVIFHGKPFSISIPFTDNASIENAIHCLCVLCILGKNAEKNLSGFGALEGVAMRLEIKPGINRCTIINDSYSNDLQSLSIAIDFLKKQKHHSRKTVIFSDILQSGIEPGILYDAVSSLFQQHQIDQLIGIGEEISANREAFSALPNCSFFNDTQEFLNNFPFHLFHDETILIKGARKFAFEKISHLLEEKVHETVLSINLSHLLSNLKTYKQILKPSTKLMCMVKAFSYGSGSHEIASVLEFNKVDYLAVAYADEGVDLRKAGISLPIMVMNINENGFDAIVNNNLEPELFSFKILHAFIDYLVKNEISNYPVHLKIDTGMHRLGFSEDDLVELKQIISYNKFLWIKSVFTHLVASDDESEDKFTLQQFHAFQNCASALQAHLPYTFLKHISNTSAIGRFPELEMDMVRLGIGLYGIESNESMQKNLKNVSTLNTTISQIKKVKANDTVGYNRKGKLYRDSSIATVRLGYADGYARSLGNGIGKMLVSGKLAPVIGNVCMDMTMLDITGIENVHEGDQVMVFGEELPVQLLAGWAHTIPYEILTSISQRVKRVYFEE
ncbi:MAG: bifunctional UDP-N-acetylmuramoyl-tripeptide:D-alanyl-D-alanine ligase/alanine racemase [Ginsengibacter sp.]